VGIAPSTDGTQVTRHWYKALRRRSQRTRLTWTRMDRIAKRWLPPARVMHPFPDVRIDRRHCPRQEPSAVIPHAAMCGAAPRAVPAAIVQSGRRNPKDLEAHDGIATSIAVDIQL
jgi:hypothetical protein